MTKKIFSLLIALFAVLTMNAQTAVQTSKVFDNTYVGVQAGVNTPLSFNQVFPLNEYAGLRAGKNFTPVLGLNVDAGVTFNDHANGHTNGLVNHFPSSAAVNTINVGLNGTVNLMNLIGGYKGAPRFFEISTVTGLGWSHIYNKNVNIAGISDDDELIAKTGADFTLNLGKKKAWQVYAEPAVVWNLTNGAFDEVHFNKDHAYLQLLVGVNYKFKTSNGTHNFKTYDIGALNDKINDLQAELAKKPKEVVKTVNNTTVIDNTKYVIFFAQNSADLSDKAKGTLDNIEGSVSVQGYASPEGTSTYNKNLSQKRAQAVADYLTSKGVKVVGTAGKGVDGQTSNRVVIVSPEK